MKDINHIATALERKTTQKDPKDEISIKMWLDSDLREQGTRSFCKDRQDPPPQGSRLAEDLFILVLQTRFQSDAFQHLGGGILSIDATHNMTCYSGVMLITIMARDHWGHGKQMNFTISDKFTQLIFRYARVTGSLDAVIQYTV